MKIPHTTTVKSLIPASVESDAVLTAIWFSRHPMTAEQRAEFTEAGVDVLNKSDWASLDMNGDDDIHNVIVNMAHDITAAKYENSPRRFRRIIGVFGVFAAPLQCAIMEDNGVEGAVPCFAAWNVRRSVEGGPATFAHKGWFKVGGWKL